MSKDVENALCANHFQRGGNGMNPSSTSMPAVSTYPQNGISMYLIAVAVLLIGLLILVIVLIKRQKGGSPSTGDVLETAEKVEPESSASKGKKAKESLPADGETFYAFAETDSTRRCPYCDGEYESGSDRCTICGKM